MAKSNLLSCVAILVGGGGLASGCSESAADTVDGGLAAVVDAGAAECTSSDQWQRHLIGALERPMYIDVRDIDGDGDPDVLAATMVHSGEADSEVAWFRNEGGGQAWTRTVIAAIEPDPIKNTTGVVAVDVDRDGHLDAAVATAAPGLAQVYWFRAPEDPTLEQWERHMIFESPNDIFYKIYAWDANDDSWPDLVVGAQASGIILTNPAEPAREDRAWGVQTMPGGTGLFVFLDDMNGDNRLDVVSSNFYANTVSWTAVTATDTGFSHALHVIDENLSGAFDPFPVDINLDGHKDLLVSRIMSRGINWYEAPTTAEGDWTKHTVSATFRGADLYAGDINADGHTDFVVSGVAMGGAEGGYNVTWFRRVPNALEPTWSEEPLWCLKPDSPGDIALADIDGDGDQDVITTGNHDNEVIWFENLVATP